MPIPNSTVPVNLYGQAVGSSSTTPFITIFNTRDPTSSDVNYQTQQRWFNTEENTEWILVNFATSNAITTANWQSINNAGVLESIHGDTGTAIPSSGYITFNANTTCGSSVLFSASGSTVTLRVTDSNNNTLIGNTAGTSSVTGTSNSSLGFGSLGTLTGGIDNSAFGYGSLAALTSGGRNTSLGHLCLNVLVSGSFNTCVGDSSGTQYTTSESSNICISHIGVTGDSHTTRIGTQGSGNEQQNLCYIAGMAGASLTAGSPTVGAVIIDTSNGQLVSATTGVSTSGYVLTSTGTTSLPTWQATTQTNTFIPGIAFGGSSTGITYSEQKGEYMLIGNTVFFSILVTLSSKGAQTGNATMTGFPFSTSAPEQSIVISDVSALTFDSTNSTVFLNTAGATTAFTIYEGPLSRAILTNSNFADNTRLQTNGFYFVN